MSREDLIQTEGVIVDELSGGHYSVKITNDQVISAKLCGKMRKFYIKVVVGDAVTVGLSPYDLSHGLIMYRHNPNNAQPPASFSGPRKKGKK